MKIKKPSLKGIKNTKYLGHFAKDEYIQKGHNFSGRPQLNQEPSQLEMMGQSNPFDVASERTRRYNINMGEIVSQLGTDKARDVAKRIASGQMTLADTGMNEQEQQWLTRQAESALNKEKFVKKI